MHEDLPASERKELDSNRAARRGQRTLTAASIKVTLENIAKAPENIASTTSSIALSFGQNIMEGLGHIVGGVAAFPPAPEEHAAEHKAPEQ